MYNSDRLWKNIDWFLSVSSVWVDFVLFHTELAWRFVFGIVARSFESRIPRQLVRECFPELLLFILPKACVLPGHYTCTYILFQRQNILASFQFLK